MRVLIVAAGLLLVAILSGCIDESAPDPVGDENDGDLVVVDDETGETRVVLPRTASFKPGEAGALWTEEYTGVFTPGQNHWPVGMAASNAGVGVGQMHTYDISEFVPMGQPGYLITRVESAMAHGDLDLFTRFPNMEVWTFESNSPEGGDAEIIYGFVHTTPDPVVVHVLYDKVEPVAEVAYTLTVEIHSSPAFLWDGIPAAIPVTEDTVSMELNFLNDKPGAYMLFDPDDDFIGRFQATEAVHNHTFAEPVNGDYVIMTDQYDGPAVVTLYEAVPTDSEAPGPATLGLVQQVGVLSDTVSFPADAPVTAEFEWATVPLQIGFILNVETYLHDATGSLAGPEGPLVSRTLSNEVPDLNPVPNTGGLGFGGFTPMGGDGLTAGTYTFDFEAQLHGAGEVFLWAAGYER